MNDSDEALFELLQKCPTLRAGSGKSPEKDLVSGKDVVIYFGANNVGKSVGINMMLGTDLEIAPGMGDMRGEETVVKKNQQDDGPEIGSRENPKAPTKTLTCYRRQGDLYSHCDMPGAESALSLYDWVATACQVKHAFENARTVRFVYAADPSGFTGAELLNTVRRTNQVFLGSDSRLRPFPIFATRFGYRSSQEMEQNMEDALKRGQFASFRKLGFPVKDVMLAPRASIFGSSGRPYFSGIEEERKRNIEILGRATGLKTGELQLDFEEWMDGESKDRLHTLVSKIIARHLLQGVDKYATEKHVRGKKATKLRDLLEGATKEICGEEGKYLETLRFLYPNRTRRAAAEFVEKGAEHFKGRHDQLLEEVRNKDILYGNSFYAATDRSVVSPLSSYLYRCLRQYLPKYAQSDFMEEWVAPRAGSSLYNQRWVKSNLEFSSPYKQGHRFMQWASELDPLRWGLQILYPELVWQEMADEKFLPMRRDLTKYFENMIRSGISNQNNFPF